MRQPIRLCPTCGQAQWNSVKDSLPAEPSMCLVFCPVYAYESCNQITMCWYDKAEGGFDIHYEVTHWMYVEKPNE